MDQNGLVSHLVQNECNHISFLLHTCISHRLLFILASVFRFARKGGRTGDDLMLKLGAFVPHSGEVIVHSIQLVCNKQN